MPTPNINLPKTGTPASPKQASPPPPIAYEVECVDVDSMEKNVTILENVAASDKPAEMKPHTCVRRCWEYKFELDRKPLTHPAVTVTVESLEPLPFQIRQRYTVSFQ